MTSTSDDALRGRDEEHGELLLLTIEYLRLFPAFPVNFFLHLVEARCSGTSMFNISGVCSPRSPFLFWRLKSSRSERLAWSFRQKTQLASQLDSSSWLFNFISQLIRQNQFQEGLQIQRSAAAFPVQLCRQCTNLCGHVQDIHVQLTTKPKRQAINQEDVRLNTCQEMQVPSVNP